jgi:hypothetical protein
MEFEQNRAVLCFLSISRVRPNFSFVHLLERNIPEKEHGFLLTSSLYLLHLIFFFFNYGMEALRETRED